MSFLGFVHNYKLKNTATSKIKVQQILSSLTLSDSVIDLKGGLFSSDLGICNLHRRKGKHWVVYINQIYLDSYSYSPLQNLGLL